MRKQREQKRGFMRKASYIFVYFSLFIFVLGMNAIAAGNNLSTATPYSVGSKVSGTMVGGSYSGSYEYYRFYLAQNSVIRMETVTGGHTQHLYVDILNSAGYKLDNYSFSTNDNNNWGYQKCSGHIALNAGTYFIRIGKNTTNKTYTLSTSVVEKQINNTKIAAINNKYLKDALPITIGNRLYSVACGTEHYYRFSISSDQTIQFRSQIFGDYGNVYVYLYDANGNYICKIRSIDYGQTYTDSVSLKKGTYFIRVSKTGRGRYEIQTSTIKKSQSITTKVSSKTYSKASVNRKSYTFRIGAKAKTKLTYSSSNPKYVTVSSKGKVTVKKRAKKGLYRITIRAAESSGYRAAKKTIKIRIR